MTTGPTLTTADGTPLHLRRWARAGARGGVLLVHGLGEHIGRYEQVAAWLTARGFEVAGYDQRGHGRSAGARGVLRTGDDPLSDLALVVDAVRTAGRPLILLGHSSGGAFAAQFVAEARRPVDALVLSSPALAATLSLLQRLRLAIGLAVAPSLAQGNGLDPEGISRDAGVVHAYRTDPLVHDRVTALLARAILAAGAAALTAAPVWKVPTLLLYSGADRLVAPAGSDRFAALAPREVVEAERFDALFHEILNEGAAAASVYAHLERWLDARVPRER
jgi:alpha-beta hydrolase superfamily lysophospholipase